MNILILGGGPGSWQMRGVQLGAALGARVTSAPTEADWTWAERVVLVKRAGMQWAAQAHTRGLPVVWDALDFWRQPTDNALSEPAARELLRRVQDQIAPVLTIGATGAMAKAAGGVYVAHHGRAGLVPTAAREVCQVVGYDGNPAFLDAWHPALESVCRRLGWTFVINPPDLAQVDILVALRGGVWDGWMCREWKSGVKIVNAILAGRPLIGQPSAAWRELLPHGSVIESPAGLCDSMARLATVLEEWAPLRRRQVVVEDAKRRIASFTLDTLAAQYAGRLADLKGCLA